MIDPPQTQLTWHRHTREVPSMEDIARTWHPFQASTKADLGLSRESCSHRKTRRNKSSFPPQSRRWDLACDLLAYNADTAELQIFFPQLSPPAEAKTTVEITGETRPSKPIGISKCLRRRQEKSHAM